MTGTKFTGLPSVLHSVDEERHVGGVQRDARRRRGSAPAAPRSRRPGSPAALSPSEPSKRVSIGPKSVGCRPGFGALAASAAKRSRQVMSSHGEPGLLVVGGGVDRHRSPVRRSGAATAVGHVADVAEVRLGGVGHRGDDLVAALGHGIGVAGDLVEQTPAARGRVVDLVDVGAELAAPGGHAALGLPGTDPAGRCRWCRPAAA